jgi:outer membrane biosynthesis protein TonB
MNKRNRNILIALILSLLFHVGLLFLLHFWHLLKPETNQEKEKVAQEVTVVFPENKPKPAEKEQLIVENQNETDEVPDNTNLLSEKNSRARNPEKTNQVQKNTPFSQGNVNLQELSNPKREKKPPLPYGYKRFSSDALVGKQTDNQQRKKGEANPLDREGVQSQSQSAQSGINQRMQQKKFSVEEVGALSLSTYAWEWAPYVRKLKEKHSNVWFSPPAYNRLGIIHGATKIVFEISRDGTLLNAKVIEHKGHESLEVASFASIKAIFPFLPLPKDFPDESLTITATLVYPDLKKLYRRR